MRRQGLEPRIPRVRAGCFTCIARGACQRSRATPRCEPHAGIEPASSAWRAVTLAVVLVRQTRVSANFPPWLLLGSNQRPAGLQPAALPSELKSQGSGLQGSNLRPHGPEPCALPAELKPVVLEWTTGGSNPAPPVCSTGALPDELAAHASPGRRRGGRKWHTKILCEPDWAALTFPTVKFSMCKHVHPQVVPRWAGGTRTPIYRFWRPALDR